MASLCPSPSDFMLLPVDGGFRQWTVGSGDSVSVLGQALKDIMLCFSFSCIPAIHLKKNVFQVPIGPSRVRSYRTDRNPIFCLWPWT